MTRMKLEAIVRRAGGEIDGNRIFLPDEDLKEHVPAVTITSPKTAPQEVGLFALNDIEDFDFDEALAAAWDRPVDEWWDNEWETRDNTVDYMRYGWKNLALRLLLA